jgi:hypothetical protein
MIDNVSMDIHFQYLLCELIQNVFPINPLVEKMYTSYHEDFYLLRQITLLLDNYLKNHHLKNVIFCTLNVYF